MADIVEVIHKINYEVNDGELQNAVNVMHAQIRELNNLYGALERYQRQLANVRDTTAFNELSRKVDGATRQIEASLGKTKGILAQFGSGLLKGLGLETDLEGVVAKWLEPLNTHLESVKNKGGDTVTSLGGIAAKLTSFSGLAPSAIELLSLLEATSTPAEYRVPDRSVCKRRANAHPGSRQMDQPGDVVEFTSVRKMELTPVQREPQIQKIDVPANDFSGGKKLSDKRKENIEKAKETYQTLAKTAVETFNTIYHAQIASLDEEIDLRKQRVEQATLLAEKGNTEQLALEQDRLAKAEAARDNAARKQLQLNALLQASNSAVALTEAIGAVVSAAAQGDPYTIALRVAAAVAALVAGIAAVSTAFGKVNSGGAYKDGVVDFNGVGGPRDDANWVRISSGESVITAKGTAANRSILEAINKGAEFKMLNPQLAMPALVAMGAGGFASKENLKGLEKKLDGVIDAVRDNKLKQDIFFNEHGVGLMTQRVIRRDQNRFR